MGSTAVQAHRGSPDPSSGVRENTVAAFLRAHDLGADGVELDVRMTADGGLAVHHDAQIDGAGAVCELTTSELPVFVPLLPEVLEALEGLTVNVEIKNLPNEPGFDPAERVAREVAALVTGSGRESEVVVSSFWPGALEAVRDASADLVTALLLVPHRGNDGPPEPLRAVDAAIRLGCTAVHPHLDLVDDTLVGEAHQAGLSVAAWTVNARRDLSAMASVGVDTVITDDVSLALAVIDRV